MPRSFFCAHRKFVVDSIGWVSFVSHCRPQSCRCQECVRHIFVTAFGWENALPFMLFFRVVVPVLRGCFHLWLYELSPVFFCF